MKKLFKNRIILVTLFISALAALYHLSSANSPPVETNHLTIIESVDHFNDILANSQDKLIVVDLYADWCAPCRILTPLLNEIASEMQDQALFLKIDTEKHPEIMMALQADVLPMVYFVKNQQVVHALAGLHSREVYVDAIEKYSAESTEPAAHGTIRDGIRKVDANKQGDFIDIVVHRGDSIRVSFGERDYKRSLSLPALDRHFEADPGEELLLSMTIRDKSDLDLKLVEHVDGKSKVTNGNISVYDYKGQGGIQYQDISVQQALEIVNQPRTVVLDVRTNREFSHGHIENSVHIPLNELERRIEELSEYREKDLLVYCRSGNRSAVASRILLQNGFSSIFHLESGIRGWLNEGNNLAKD
ncbi:thioredoxin domain-containing protein [Chitinispirillales bacterium ANBcel5]|uniref:thioredoxin domain-containing protein n=1 Tax=Cellulosispirillum alkaliphilum TaxID=3039283 RepID=UPI002A564A4C|nr:thioredoxin domain-containing protein [Chitinispirillales bacterium ANBcel5]